MRIASLFLPHMHDNNSATKTKNNNNETDACFVQSKKIPFVCRVSRELIKILINDYHKQVLMF